MKVAFYMAGSGRRPVEEFIAGLPGEDQSKIALVIEGLKAYGLGYHGVAFRHLSGKLWEIKFAGRGGGYRVAYVMLSGDMMVWLHAFRKTSQKTPRSDLDVALKRMKEILK
jgi:phage-related protein